jgi:hypothetical protein
MWLSSINLAKHNQQRYPDRYKIIRYETLAAQPEETLCDICAFIGEDYTSEMLAMEGATNFREEGGNSSYGQREPGVISTNSIGRFRQVLSKREIAFMQAWAGQEMLAFDYQPEHYQFTFNELLLFACADWPVNLARLAAWRMLNAIQNKKGRTLPSYRIVPEVSSLQS